MKKIISLLLLVVLVSTNFSFGTGGDKGMEPEEETSTQTNTDQSNTVDDDTETSCSDQDTERKEQLGNGDCPTGYDHVSALCCEPITATETSTSSMGISCSPEQLVNGQCKMSIYDTLGIRKSVRNDGDATSVGLFVQDIVLSATFFIGTLVTVALIVSGLMFIFAASSGKDPANAKKGMVGSLIGLLVVVSSYVIIRLVQYIAKGF